MNNKPLSSYSPTTEEALSIVNAKIAVAVDQLQASIKIAAAANSSLLSLQIEVEDIYLSLYESPNATE